ncbi:MAG: hypothetical protein C0410_05625 [Anaerolinea sp.]|nr:hypothetical protein [Anaerolinea sp.]
MTQKEFTPDLSTLPDNDKVVIPDELNINWVEDIKGRSALHVQPTKKEFFVEDEWIINFNGIEFVDGEIEFDALGKSNPPQSNFLGVAFHVLSESTHDAVYFRPFNFKSDDPERQSHAVQYISHPEYRWFNLRQDKPGEYEKPVNSAPDGDHWFHARIVVKQPKVSVYVNHEIEPCLDINELGSRLGNGIGLWCGPGQGGYFANLKITRF